MKAKRVALVHDWLTGMRGGEKALEVLCERYPDAELFTLVHVPGSVSPTIERRLLVNRLKRVDLPTLGRPTMATNGSASAPGRTGITDLR